MHEHDSPRPSPPSDSSRSPSVGEALVLGSALKSMTSADEKKVPADRVTVRQRQRNGRRGVVLVFVVVLLTLLGIMGTAYLASSRLDRQAIIGRGSLTPLQTGLLKDPSKLDAVEASVEQAVKVKIIRDLFNIAPSVQYGTTAFSNLAGAGTFRQMVGSYSGGDFRPPWYSNYDAPGRADPYLSSLLPTRHPDPAFPGFFTWTWISAPIGDYAGTANVFLDPFFSDPRHMTFTGLDATRFASFAHGGGAVEVYPGQDAAVDNTAVTQRHNATIGSLSLLRSGIVGTDPLALQNSKTRVYPAIAPGGLDPTVAANVLLAGDADGDGIADGGLEPVQIQPTTTPLSVNNSINYYLDTTNNVIYFASYRVVDNSAKLNLATALDVRGDIADMTVANSPSGENFDSTVSPPTEMRNYLADQLDATTTNPTPGTYGPNYGFFRSNVGLTGLLRTFLSPVNQTAVNDATNTGDNGRVVAQVELRRFVDARFPFLKQNPDTSSGTPYAQNTANDTFDLAKLSTTFTQAAVTQFRTGTVLGPPNAATGQLYEFRSFGDVLEQQVARRPLNPGGYLWEGGASSTAVPSVQPAATIWFGTGDALSLGSKGGALANELVSPGPAEQSLLLSLRMATPNVNSNGDTPWGWFPANAVDLWFGWTQDFEQQAVPPVAAPNPSVITAVDDPNPTNRAFLYNPATSTGLAPVYLPRSPRVLLTTYNGVTTTVPRRGDGVVGTAPAYAPGPAATPGLPIGMPAYVAGEARDTLAKSVAVSVLGLDPTLTNPTFSYPNVKVSAATGTKEQLWRAFWSAMTEQRTFTYLDPVTGLQAQSTFWAPVKRLVMGGSADAYMPNEQYDAFRSSDRYGTLENSAPADPARPYLPPASASQVNEQRKPDQTLSPRQMALIRSAVAACNTIDLRDNDQDITAMDVDITDDDRATATTRYYARVYGTEKQLVISSVYMEAATPYVAIEIYNPSDEAIQLSAYRLAVVTRTPGTPETMSMQTGTITNPAGNTPPIPLSAATTDYLQPGGYVILSSGTVPAGLTGVPLVSGHSPASPGIPDTYLIDTTANPNVSQITQAAAGPGSREIVLLRTRRADGMPFVDMTATGTVRNAIENEDTVNAANVMSLVPVDGVDCRFANNGTLTPLRRYMYQRPRPALPVTPTSAMASDPLNASDPAFANRPNAWRCFYAGKFYPQPALGNVARDPYTPSGTGTGQLNDSAALTGDFAWRELGASAGAVQFAPTAAVTYVDGTPRDQVNAIMSPVIPIQNFTPVDPFIQGAAGIAPYDAPGTTGAANQTALRGIFHLVNRFPYGSPFAREMDLWSIPYIGTYKIYRQTGAGATPDLYEFVPLPMDAVTIASNLTDAEVDPVSATQIKTFGRFDPRIGAATPRNNEWAANLTDFVTARHTSQNLYIPDVPDASNVARFQQVPGGGNPPYASQDQRYAQDGPVTGSGAANLFPSVHWVSFTERGVTNSDAALPTASDQRVGQRAGLPVTGGSTLTQGVINLNAAPQIVLRQLPWVVDPANGQVDYLTLPSGTGLEPRPRVVVNALDRQRDTLASQAYDPATTPAMQSPVRQFGFGSLPEVDYPTAATASPRPLYEQNGTAMAVGPSNPTANELLREGVLNPINQCEETSNYLIDNANLNRISNLTSTRSDVFTVYVTVQAWTWNGNNQMTNTRLVGERRSSFVVDRSKIDSNNFDLSNLIVLPIERE